jgi:restriction endonuclease S subunit
MHPETLPPDWRMVTFGEMAFHIADRVDDPKSAGVEIYVGLEHIDPGSLRIKRWGTPDDVGATKLRVKPGQIIFGKRRAYQRKVAVSHFDGICSAHAMVLEANIETTAPGFLGFFMQSDLFFDTALAISEGSLSPTIKWKTLAAQQFPLPPRARQQEMVELFQALEEAIAATEESLAAAEELKRALLRELLTRGIGHSEFKQTEIGPVPVAWEVVRLKKVFHRVQYGLSIAASTEGTYPILRMMNLVDGYVVENDLKYIELDDDELEKYRLREGDILFNRTNSLDLVGKVGIYQLSGTHVFASYLLRLDVDREMAIPAFINYYLNLSTVQAELRTMATPGVSQANINPTSLQSIYVPIPDLDEQQHIVKALTTADEQIESLRTHKTHLASLKAQAINRLLTGQHDAARAGVEAAIV